MRVRGRRETTLSTTYVNLSDRVTQGKRVPRVTLSDIMLITEYGALCERRDSLCGCGRHLVDRKSTTQMRQDAEGAANSQCLLYHVHAFTCFRYRVDGKHDQR